MPRMRLLPPPRSLVQASIATGAVAAGAFAVGAVAFGAVAVGAFAVGKLGVGKLRMKLGRFERLHVGELTVDRLVVRDRPRV